MTFFSRRKAEVTSTEFAFSCLRRVGNDLQFTDPQEVMKFLFTVPVAFLGPPGAGKSTLATAVMNTLMGNNTPYFATSATEAFSFTNGAWIVNQREKRKKQTHVDVIDVEGLVNTKSSHHLAIVVTALSRALVICNANARLDATETLLDTLAAGVKLMQAKGIAYEKPKIYLEVPEQFFPSMQINGMPLTPDEYPAFIKEFRPEFTDFEMEIFTMPRFENGTPDEPFYTKVRELINKWGSDSVGKSMPVRLNYATQLLDALKSEDPVKIQQLNQTFFQNDIKDIHERLHKNLRVTILQEHEGERINAQKSYENFILYNSKSFKDDFLIQCRASPYYNPADPFYERAIANKNCVIQIGNTLRDIYNREIARYKAVMREIGDTKKAALNEVFQSFIKAEFAKYMETLKFNSYLSSGIPHHVQQAIATERNRLIAIFTADTHEQVPIPSDFLNYNAELDWSVRKNDITARWEAQKANAKWINRVSVQGSESDFKCSSCNSQHNNSGVTHKACSDSLWYWVDRPTNYAMCDKCCDLQTITSVCCYNCSKPLAARVVTN